MLKCIVLTVVCLSTYGTAAIAGNSARWEYQGTTPAGEKVYLDLNSIQLNQQFKIQFSKNTYFFDYKIGAVPQPLAFTNCDGTFQVVMDDGVTFKPLANTSLPKPEPGTTRRMLNRICGSRRQTIKAGVYNVGSRYIEIAHKGDRICYQGISFPSGRYAVAVGETTGSLSYEQDHFVIDGWKKYGRIVTLRQQGENLLVTHDDGWSAEYTFFSRESLGGRATDSTIRCLNSSGIFFETAPGYSIKIKPTQSTTIPNLPSVASLITLEPKPDRRSINLGLTFPSPNYMKSVLGVPGQLSADCSSVTNANLKKLIVTESVGSFRVTGLKPAVFTIRRVLDKVKIAKPDLYKQLGTEGMLCVRKVRGSSDFSNHSWGTAVDIKINQKLDIRGDNKTQAGLKELYPYFHAEGFYWGAAFPTEDSMHFETSQQLIEKWKSVGEIP